MLRYYFVVIKKVPDTVRIEFAALTGHKGPIRAIIDYQRIPLFQAAVCGYQYRVSSPGRTQHGERGITADIHPMNSDKSIRVVPGHKYSAMSVRSHVEAAGRCCASAKRYTV